MRIIPQPGDRTIEIKHGDVSFEMKLKWVPSFSSEKSKRFWQAQCFVDSECVRHMIPYTPKRNGILLQSPKLGTTIGTGRIEYASPYARYQYYGNVYGPNIPIYKNKVLIGWFSPPKKYPTGAELQYSTDKNSKAGKLWFERMKADKGDAILRGAAKIAGGEAE